MPSEPPKSERERKLEQFVTLLAERLAVAVVYLLAIDDSVDPFRKKDLAGYSEMDWLVATLATKGRSEIFGGYRFADPFAVDCEEIINAARANKAMCASDTEAFAHCLNSVRMMLRKGNEQIASRADSGASPQARV